MLKFHVYHTLLVIGNLLVLSYSLYNQVFLPTLVYTLVAIPLLLVNQKLNKPATK